MLPKRPRRQDPDTLTWEYLDGMISPSRARVLSSMLTERVAARRRFVEAAVLHGMLFEYFKDARANETQEAEDAPAGRRKRRRTPAA